MSTVREMRATLFPNLQQIGCSAGSVSSGTVLLVGEKMYQMPPIGRAVPAVPVLNLSRLCLSRAALPSILTPQKKSWVREFRHMFLVSGRRGEKATHYCR